MPANLTPQYHKAEEEYRRAETPEDELRCLQAMLREIPKHKGTDHLQADLKQRISRAKKEIDQQKRAGGRRTSGLRIPRQGAGRAVLIGGPNAGKSLLLRSLTNATPEVAPYPFTTRQPAPGMMPWEDVFVQLIDTPPITADVLDAATAGLLRGADLALLLVDLGEDDGILQVQDVVARLEGTKTRLGRESSTGQEDVGLTRTSTLLVPNKIDLPDAPARLELLRECCPLGFPEHVISAQEGTGLDELRAAVYRSLDVIRVYTKEPSNKEPDLQRPYTVRRGSTLLDVAVLVHKDFAAHLKYARIWGQGVHGGTAVKGNHLLHDRDIVELHV
ncbi:MAG: 50S ribosome-binding GTPase [Planctomycetes bacterium]|nr:50S ribosome-binding GTPase [Planctomycetota bacterium]